MNSDVSFFRFYKPFVIAAPIVFVLMLIVYVIANMYYYMIVGEGKMEADTANAIVGCFRIAPVIVTAGLLILGKFVADRNREKHMRMIAEIHRAEENKPSIFTKI